MRKKFIRLEMGKADRRRIKSNSANSLSFRNAANAALRPLADLSFFMQRLVSED